MGLKKGGQGLLKKTDILALLAIKPEALSSGPLINGLLGPSTEGENESGQLIAAKPGKKV
jgi:hypothetical protein